MPDGGRLSMGMLLRLLCLTREADRDLSEELVGAVAVVVPHGDLEHLGAEVAPPDREEHKGLVPLRAARVGHGLGPALALLATTTRRRTS